MGLQVPIGAASRLAPADALLLLGAGLAVTGRRLQRPAAALPWLLLPALLAYGLLVSMAAGRPLTQYLLVSKFAGGLSLAAAGFLFQGHVRRLTVARVCHHLLWGAVVVNTLGYIEFRLGVLSRRGFVWDAGQRGRFSGLAVDSNANAALLATAALCGLHLLLVTGRRDPRWRLATTGAVAWCGYLFLISYSRGALVALAGTLVAYYWRRAVRRRAGRVEGWHLVAGLAGAAALIIRSPVDFLIGGRTDLRSVDDRLELLDQAIELLDERELNWATGIGLGTFQSVYDRVIHSTPAWLYVEMGVLGALYVAVLGGLVLLWIRRADRLGAGDTELCLAILVLYGLMALSIEALYQRPLWIALGCLAGLPAGDTPAPTSRRENRRSALRVSAEPKLEVPGRRPEHPAREGGPGPSGRTGPMDVGNADPGLRLPDLVRSGNRRQRG